MSDSHKCQSSERIPLLDAQAESEWGILPCEARRTFGAFEFDGAGPSAEFESESGSGSRSSRPALPLASVEVSASIVDRIASVTVVQKFVNQLKEPIEAVYIFPLAGSSSVSKFQMQVGERTIEGIVKERAAARQEYQVAIDEGKRAALLEQERDDVFTAQVGNIMPGEEITVTIVYCERLTYFASGHTEIRLPLVVAPRYVAGIPLERPSVGDGVELDTDLVSDASRISPPRLVAGFDPKVSLSIDVNIELADDDQLNDLVCSQHATKSAFGKNAGTGRSIIKVGLVKEDELLDRDFVLSWKLAGAAVSSVGLVSAKPSRVNDTEFQYGMVSINPPALKRENSKVVARDVVFLLDRSGSMNGLKMTSAARSLIILLNTLRPDDRFAICAFDTAFEWLEDKSHSSGHSTRKFLPASLKSIERGVTYLRSIDARGGTEMQGALEVVFDAIEVAAKLEEPSLKPKAKASTKLPAKRQAIVVLITDGEVADESHILKTIQGRLNATRVFTVGVDTAVNDGFLKRLANLGGGTCTLVPPGDALENALINVAREIGVPLITDLHIVDSKQLTCAPAKTIDLFEGRPVSIHFQCTPDKLPANIEVEGRLAGGGKYKEKISLATTDNSALPQLYAKARISELEDLMRDAGARDGRVHEREIVELSVAHCLLTRFTAFLAIDHSDIANTSGAVRKQVQPVESPAQWKELAASGWGAAPAAMPMLPFAEQPACPGSPAPGNSPRAKFGFISSRSSAPQSQSFGAPPSGFGAADSSSWGSSGIIGPTAGGPPSGLGAGSSGYAGRPPAESAEVEKLLFESLGASADQNLDSDWSEILAILHRLEAAVAVLLKIVESGATSLKKEMAELCQIESELRALTQSNQTIASHPGVSPVFKEKILPSLCSVIKLIAAENDSSSLAQAEQIAEIKKSMRLFSLCCEQVMLYSPEPDALIRFQKKKKDAQGDSDDSNAFWKQNI
ncbi:MAG: VIT domain-containing protein [Candidatus Obscuribacterales bacterium]